MRGVRGVRGGETGDEAYLCEVRVGIEATLVAHHGATLRAGVVVWLAIRGAHEVGGVADGTELATRHGCYLRH